jgi:trigger factor
LEITLEKESKIAKLRVSLKEADYRPKVAEKVKEYSKKASIKGFRPGKVPASLIDRMYGKSILVDEINHIVSHSISDYIKNNKLNIVGEPLPAEENNNVDWDSQKEFEFLFNIGLVPDFNLNLDEP